MEGETKFKCPQPEGIAKGNRVTLAVLVHIWTINATKRILRNKSSDFWAEISSTVEIQASAVILASSEFARVCVRRPSYLRITKRPVRVLRRDCPGAVR